MAVNKQNVVVEGASGKLGKTLVFRQKGGVTVMAVPPKKNQFYVPTVEQIDQRFKFTEASFYAKNAILDPILKAAYLAKAKANQSAYNVAFKDFTTAPILHSINYSNYTGAIGDTLSCRITDILSVLSVKVSLYDTDGVFIEEGMAIQSDLKLDWVYTATVVHTPVLGTKIVVTMTDTPGNVYVRDEVIGS